MAYIQAANVFIPENFSQTEQQITEVKSALVQSGVLARDPRIDAQMAAGLIFSLPSQRDLGATDSTVMTDSTGDTITPQGTTTDVELAVRLSRAKAYSWADLALILAAGDPAGSLVSRTGADWERDLQRIFIATATGVFNDNEAAPAGSEHVQNDLTLDLTDTYQEGVTTFSGEAFIDGCQLLGDAAGDVALVCMHSYVYARLLKNDQIDFKPDSQGTDAGTFRGRQIIVDDSMPFSGGDFETWLFARGAFGYGVGSHPNPAVFDRNEAQGAGGGVETFYTRKVWVVHPNGHKYDGTAASGGPSNANSSNNLAHAASWKRVVPERKMVKIARILTTEF